MSFFNRFSQLISANYHVKAANPGCILEDFVRWHSPPDWIETEPSTEAESLDGSDVSSTRGQLSSRMQKEGAGSFCLLLLYFILHQRSVYPSLTIVGGW